MTFDNSRVTSTGKIVSRTYVYFIQAVTGGKIKIGYSQYPMRRLEQLMDWSPEKLILLAFAPGGQSAEGRLHAHFKEYWSHKEWFHPAPAVVSMAKWVASTAEIPLHVLPVFTSYKEMPHRKQVGKRTDEQRENMSRVQKAVWANRKSRQAIQ